MPDTRSPSPVQTAVVGGGCFWCLDAAYRRVKGVQQVVSGYAGGTTPNPTYDQVASGRTGHAEVVQITFQPDTISYTDLLDIFWILHDPTTKNRQQYDVGTEYRSIILTTGHQQTEAQASRTAVAKLWPNPIVTEIKPLDTFYPAETYHQNYYANHPDQAYCQIIINPKLDKLRHKFQNLLKTDPHELRKSPTR